jgi:hypothetical protein
LASCSCSGRHVAERAHREARLGVARRLELGDPEVRELEHGGIVGEHVLGLDVAVHHPGGVDRLEALQQLHRRGDRQPRRHLAVGLDPPVQRAAVEQLHHDERELRAVGDGGGADVVHPDEVGVRQAGHGDPLVREPRPDGLIAREAGQQHLDRPPVLLADVPGRVHAGHAALPHPGEQHVAVVGQSWCRVGERVGGAAASAESTPRGEAPATATSTRFLPPVLARYNAVSARFTKPLGVLAGRPRRHPAADGDGRQRRPVLRGEPGVGDRLSHPLGGLARRVQVGVRQDDGELLAAVARDVVGRPEPAAERVGHRDQDPIAGGVAHGVVEALEVVDVDHDHRHGPLGRGAREQARQVLVEPAAVEGVGEPVVGGLAAGLVEGLAQRSDLALELPRPPHRGPPGVGPQRGIAGHRCAQRVERHLDPGGRHGGVHAALPPIGLHGVLQAQHLTRAVPLGAALDLPGERPREDQVRDLGGPLRHHRARLGGDHGGSVQLGHGRPRGTLEQRDPVELVARHVPRASARRNTASPTSHSGVARTAYVTATRIIGTGAPR